MHLTGISSWQWEKIQTIWHDSSRGRLFDKNNMTHNRTNWLIETWWKNGMDQSRCGHIQACCTARRVRHNDNPSPRSESSWQWSGSALNADILVPVLAHYHRMHYTKLWLKIESTKMTRCILIQANVLCPNTNWKPFQPSLLWLEVIRPHSC